MKRDWTRLGPSANFKYTLLPKVFTHQFKYSGVLVPPWSRVFKVKHLGMQKGFTNICKDHYGVGLFSRNSVPAEGTLNASADSDILDNLMIPTCGTVWSPFLFLHGWAPGHKEGPQRRGGTGLVSRPQPSTPLGSCWNPQFPGEAYGGGNREEAWEVTWRRLENMD